MRIHIFNVSATLSADMNVFLPFFLFFSVSLNWERERERERVIAMLKKGVGRNSLNVYLSFWRVPSESIFSFTGWWTLYIYIALAWRHRSFLSKILSASSPGDFSGSFNISYHFNYCPANPGSGSSPRAWHEIRPICSRRHLSSKLIFFTPISADGRRCHFRFRVLANHLASIFFLPLSGDSFGLLSLSPSHWVQTSVGFHSDLDLLLRPRGIDLDSYCSLNDHSLGGLLI